MKQNLPYLKHILDEINFLLKETKALNYKKFISNELLKRGCTRSFEIIGESGRSNIRPIFEACIEKIIKKKD